jgi:hypothetical protein
LFHVPYSDYSGQRADGHVSATCVSRDGCIDEEHLSADGLFLALTSCTGGIVDQTDGQWSSGVGECIRDDISRFQLRHM